MVQGCWTRDPGYKEVMGYKISSMVESVQGDNRHSMEQAGRRDRGLSIKMAEQMAQGNLQ